MKGYKAFNQDLTCLGFQYEIGKTFEMPEYPILCERGFHFCTTIINCYKYYPFNTNTIIAEIEAIGEIDCEPYENKLCTNKIKIIREIPYCEVQKLINLGENNTGFGNVGNDNGGNFNIGNENSGSSNNGDKNEGFCNIGHRNEGKRNIGHNNVGDYNIGDRNGGDVNIGDGNSGNNNIGDENEGYSNIGYENNGSRNIGRKNNGSYNNGNENHGRGNNGDKNVGNNNAGFNNEGHCNHGLFNVGNHNYGDWNNGSHNVGAFNTQYKQKIQLFNKDSDWTIGQWRRSEAYRFLLDVPIAMEDRQEWWDEASPEHQAAVKGLPNFDPYIFYKCTGIIIKDE